jgi:hypothetical protein
VFPPVAISVTEMPNSIWTQLTNNEWIYFVPNSKSVTVLCADQPPVHVIVLGIGKLGLSANCKGYGRSVLLQTRSILDVSNLEYESDFMSRVHLEYDCCEDLNVV